MSDRRIEPEDLGGLEELRPGDPGREALESQPRARAQLKAYRDFVAPRDHPEGARVPEAEAQLRKALEDEIGISLGDELGSGVADAGRARAPRPRAARGAPGGGGFFGALLAPRLRPALALAALVVVVGGLWMVTATRRDDEAPLMRGSTPAPDGTLAAKPAQRLAGGVLRLEWTASAEAEHYVVVFLTPDLSEITRVEALASTRLDLEPGAPPAGLASGRTVLWRAIALRGQDEVAHSQAQAITVP